MREPKPSVKDLSLVYFRKTNIERCEKAFGRPVEEWSLAEWGCALAGEVGELCNLIKKDFRGDFAFGTSPERRQELADEIADVFTYLDLLAARAGVPLSEAVIKKFNEVSDRRGCAIKLFQDDENGVG